MIFKNNLSKNERGFGHVELALAILFIGLFAFVGIKVAGVNHAATLTASQCSLLGRTFTTSSGVCNKVCASGQGSYVVTSTYDYCSGAVTAASKISASTCATYGRKALLSSSVYVGCARRADQKTTAKAPQCANTANTYYVQSTYDKCAAPTNGSVVCSQETPTKIQVPTAINVKITCKNNGTSTVSVTANSTLVSGTTVWQKLSATLPPITGGSSTSTYITYVTSAGAYLPAGNYTAKTTYANASSTTGTVNLIW